MECAVVNESSCFLIWMRMVSDLLVEEGELEMYMLMRVGVCCWLSFCCVLGVWCLIVFLVWGLPV